MALTTAMIVSSLFGYITLGCAVAAFIPLIMTNAVQRRNGTSALFLYVWLVADALNLIGIFLLGAQITQIFLAGFYCIADGLLLIELLFFGHSDWGAPNPKPSKVLVHTQKGRHGPKWEKFCETFYSFSVWDDAKLLISCVLAGISWWGLYTVYQLQVNPDYEIEHKTETTTLSFAMGLAASVTFTLARIPELWLGWRRSNRGEKPEHSLDDFLFYALIMENVCNLASIFSLSTDSKYLFAELPWIFGSIAPIIFDSLIIISIVAWLHRWDKSPRKKAMEQEEAVRQDQLDRLDREKYKLELKFAAEDRKGAALESDEEAPTGASRYRKWRVDRHNKKRGALREDHLKYQTALNEMINADSDNDSSQAHQDHFSIHHVGTPGPYDPPLPHSSRRPSVSGADGSRRRRSQGPPPQPEYDDIRRHPLYQENPTSLAERHGAV
ncbi:hypothetical protein JCM8547_007971 [Rhodosporidiobolus lusitaniae]